LKADCPKLPFQQNCSTEAFSKIRETLIDAQLLANILGAGGRALVDYFVALRCLNGYVYALDERVEGYSVNGERHSALADRFSISVVECLSTFDSLSTWLEEIKAWTIRHKDYTLREIEGQALVRANARFEENYFTALFKSMDVEYIDTGFYGQLLMSMFGTPALCAGPTLLIWNVRSRTLDIFDGLIDLAQDVANQNLSPVGLYVYGVARVEEKKVISMAFKNSRFEGQVRKVFQFYCSELLTTYKSLLLNLTSDSSLSTVAKLRTLRIIDIMETFLTQPELGPEIEKYYLEETQLIFDLQGCQN